MAAVLQFHPGMYPRMTLEEESRRFGVEVFLPDINRSSVLFDLERGSNRGPWYPKTIKLDQ